MNVLACGESGLADFLVHRMALQERIVFLEFKTFRCVLLVLHRRVTRCRLANAFCFRAFERDDDACALLGHDCVLRLVSIEILRAAKVVEKSGTSKKHYRLRAGFRSRKATLIASDMCPT